MPPWRASSDEAIGEEVCILNDLSNPWFRSFRDELSLGTNSRSTYARNTAGV
jgi:hypothetical protein